MKRIFAMILAVVMTASLLCACGEKKPETVSTSVKADYDDGYASRYAQTVTKDDSGNTVYEFTQSQYDAYTHDHRNTVSAEIRDKIVENHSKDYGEFVYINAEKKAVMIGIHKDEYDAETAAKEAPAAAEKGFAYFQNLLEPVDSIRVIYCDAGDQSVEYGSFEFTAKD